MKSLQDFIGLKLLQLPVTQRDRVNQENRDVRNLKRTTAAKMISMSGISPHSLIFCGKMAKAYPFIRQLVKMLEYPFVIIGTQTDLENSCIRSLDIEWEESAPRQNLTAGNGLMELRPGPMTNLALKEYISEWSSHLVILCLGGGLQVDSELLNLLNSTGRYIIVSSSLSRSVKGSDGVKLSVRDLLSSMDYILVSSIGSSAKELIEVLPSFDYQKVTNTTDFSYHQDGAHIYENISHHRNGAGIRISQSRSMETRTVFTESELKRMQDDNILLIYNALESHIWVSEIVQ